MNTFIRSLLQPLEKIKKTPSLQITDININPKRFEKLAYIKAFSSKE